MSGLITAATPPQRSASNLQTPVANSNLSPQTTPSNSNDNIATTSCWQSLVDKITSIFDSFLKLIQSILFEDENVAVSGEQEEVSNNVESTENTDNETASNASSIAETEPSEQRTNIVLNEKTVKDTISFFNHKLTKHSIRSDDDSRNKLSSEIGKLIARVEGLAHESSITFDKETKQSSDKKTYSWRAPANRSFWASCTNQGNNVSRKQHIETALKQAFLELEEPTTVDISAFEVEKDGSVKLSIEKK